MTDITLPGLPVQEDPRRRDAGRACCKKHLNNELGGG